MLNPSIHKLDSKAEGMSDASLDPTLKRLARGVNHGKHHLRILQFCFNMILGQESGSKRDKRKV